MLNKDSYALLDNFFYFIKMLEKNGVFMNSYRAYLLGESTFDEGTINIIKGEISKCSSGDIFRMTEELKTYKNKEDVIREKQRALKAVENDIKNIKAQLGIE